MLFRASAIFEFKGCKASQLLCFFPLSADAMLAGLAGRSNEAAVAVAVSNDIRLAA